MSNDTDLTRSTLNTQGTDQIWVPNRRIAPIQLGDLSDQLERVKQAIAPLISPATPDVPAGTPDQVASLSATESPYKTPTGQIVSDVAVTFTVNPSDTFFVKAQVWFTGYNGSSTPQLMAEGTTSPIAFLCSTTHETVTVTVTTAGSTGLSSDFSLAPTTTVVLDGVVSAPPAPSIAQSLTSTPTGYQFSFNQLSGLAADLVDGYKVYRNTINNTGTATQFAYFKHNPLNSNQIVVQDDGVPNGTIYWYWVSAINTSSLESTATSVPGSGSIISGLAPTSDNMVRNGTFSGGGANWLDSPARINIQSSDFLNGVSGLPSGNSEFKSDAVSLVHLESLDYIPIDPSKTYLMSAWVKIPSFTTVNYGGFAQYDSSKAFIDHVNGTYGYCLFAGLNVTSGSGWQYFSRLIGGNPASGSAGATQFTAGTAFIRPVFLINWTGTTTPQQIEITDVRISLVEATTIKALMSTPAGVNLISNSDFNNGVTTFVTGTGTTASVGVYDNAASGKVTHTMTTDATAPNTSSQVLQITTASGTPVPSPGWGGFFYGLGVDSGSIQLGKYHKGDTILWRIRAKIPQGYTLQNANNAFGAEGTTKWVTSQAGYGDWYTYLMEQTIGTTSTFSSIGFFYLDATSSAPVTWNVASVEALDTSVENISSSAGYHVFRQGISTYLLTQGSIVPVQAFQVTITPSATSILVSWSAGSLLRADGSTLTVPASSFTLSASAGNTYWLYLYIDSRTGAVSFANSNPPGTTASYTFAAQAGFDGRIPLTPITVTTPASGTGSAFPGGDGGSCPEEHELVEVFGKGLIPAGTVEANDYLKGYSFGSSTDIFRRVLAVRRSSCPSWRIIDGHKVSPCEPVYFQGQWLPAFRVPTATIDFSTAIKIDISVAAADDQDNEHNFWLAGAQPLLIHNTNVLPKS